MKTRVFQFFAIGLLASLVVLVALTPRPYDSVKSAGIPVTGNSNPSFDPNNPMGLPVDPDMYPNEADAIDRQSEQYRQFLLAGSQDSRPILPIDLSNPLGLPVDPDMYPNEADAIDRQSEQYRQFLLAGSQDSRPILPIDLSNPLGLPVDPGMYPNEADAIDRQSEQYRQFQITEPLETPFYMIFDDNNPVRVLNELLAKSNLDATPDQLIMDVAYRARYQITESYP